MSKSEMPDMHRVLGETLRWSAAREYRGHSKHDALNSPLLRALTLGVPFLRLAATQAVMRFPFNIRPLFGVPRRRNPKGIGLFAHALFDAFEALGDQVTAGEGGGLKEPVEEGEGLLAWLIAHASPQAGPSDALARTFGVAPAGSAAPPGGRLRGLGWGYHYPWQDVGFYQPAHFPNRVVTCWIGFALLRAFETTGKERYLQAAREAASFLLDNPRRLAESADELCLSYVPLEDITWAVMDVSALAASFCARLSMLDGEGSDGILRREARRLITFVAEKQTDYGAWYYTWPAGDSHIRHDNYHTGIILDCLAEYIDMTGDERFAGRYAAGLDYYRRHLFLENGAPRWMNDRTLPHDVHGAAAGIMAFARAGLFYRSRPGAEGGGASADCFAFSDRILEWTLKNLYGGDGHFYYQRTWWGTKRFCLMRWCNAWMCRALAYRLLAAARTAGEGPAAAGRADRQERRP